MGEFFVTFLFFFAAIAIASVFFFGWVTYVVGKGIWWAVGGLLGTRQKKAAGLLRPCPHLRCQQFNPVTARYCRRCGRSLAASDEAALPGKAAAA